MTTEKQIEANRRNAQQSTGPQTPEGKAISSQNALKFGLFSKMPVLKHEDSQEYNQVRKLFFKCLEPVGMELILAERLIHLYWRLRRVARMESSLVDELAKHHTSNRHSLDPQPVPDESLSDAFGKAVLVDMSQIHSLSNLTAYEQRLEKAFYTTYKEITALGRHRKRAENKEKQRQWEREMILRDRVAGYVPVDPFTGRELKIENQEKLKNEPIL